MVDLTKKPFYLDESQIKWVEDTIASMSLEEKIGQLFICINWTRDEEHYRKMINKFHVGGIRWQEGEVEDVWKQNKIYFEESKIPVLIAANCEQGGNGALKKGGTMIAPPHACAAGGPELAKIMARHSAQEALPVGVNWTFAPISDILFNWRNTIVNNRAFGNDVDEIIANCLAYMEGMKEYGIACCTKHFPGDGCEERDQHLVMGCNDLSIEEWDASFGKIYKTLIDEGIESFMIGHICMPAYQKKFNPSLKDEDIKPATLSPELLQNLLREQLGFNGLILTDASHMAGLSTAAPRSEQVPGAIAAGCDMFLFFNDPEEDFNYMMNGYKEGIISEERLSDALHRILGLKAKLRLYEKKFPAKEELSIIGDDSHKEAAAYCADKAITLVKDTQKLLPINVEEKKRACLYFVQSAPISTLDGTDKTRDIFVEELERAGFSVDIHKDYYDYECEKLDKANRLKIIETPPVEEFKSKYDVVFMVVNMKGYAQENNVRVRWSASHSSELPWFVHEVPTIGISLNYTNHLIDLPMMKTFINSYSPSREYIRATIEKIIGKSNFKGHYNDVVWCGRWETKI